MNKFPAALIDLPAPASGRTAEVFGLIRLAFEALARELAARDAEADARPASECRYGHSPAWGEIVWDGVLYRLSPSQAKAVRYIWERTRGRGQVEASAVLRGTAATRSAATRCSPGRRRGGGSCCAATAAASGWRGPTRATSCG